MTKLQLMRIFLLTALGLIAVFSNGCTMYVRMGQTPPVEAVQPAAVPEKPNDGTFRVVCDEYVQPDLPEMPGQPYMTEKDMKDSKAVAEMLITYLGKFLETVNERDQIRKDYFETHRKTCRAMLVENKTLPE